MSSFSLKSDFNYLDIYIKPQENTSIFPIRSDIYLMSNYFE